MTEKKNLHIYYFESGSKGLKEKSHGKVTAEEAQKIAAEAITKYRSCQITWGTP